MSFNKNKMKGVVKASFKINVAIMKFLGYYPTENYPRFYKFYSYFVCTILLLPASLLGFIQLCLIIREQKGGVIDMFSFSMTILPPKFLALVVNSGNIRQCINYFDKEIFVSQSQHHMDIVNTCAQISQRNSYVFICGDMLALLGWFVKLYFRDEIHQLPLDVWSPFSNMLILHYCLYINLLIGTVYAGLSCGTIDPLIAGLICHASGQLQVLKENLKHLDREFFPVTGDTIRMSRLIYAKITKCIEHYSAIVRFVEEYERAFSTAIFSQFANSVLTICICCLQISKSQNFDISFVFMVNSLICLLFQVFFYCYYGTILIEENNTLIDAIYMSNWYDYDLRCKKALVILMERSKRPLRVTAGKILDVSLETFTSILRKSYSLLAVLNNY